MPQRAVQWTLGVLPQVYYMCIYRDMCPLSLVTVRLARRTVPQRPDRSGLQPRCDTLRTRFLDESFTINWFTCLAGLS